MIPGAYVLTAEWKRLKPIERHRVRLQEVARRLDPGAVVVAHGRCGGVGHRRARGLAATIDLTIEPSSGGRSGGSVRRHALGLEGVERNPFGVHEITTAAQTRSISRNLPFVRAASAVDQTLWTGREGGALTTREEIMALDATRTRPVAETCARGA